MEEMKDLTDPSLAIVNENGFVNIVVIQPNGEEALRIELRSFDAIEVGTAIINTAKEVENESNGDCPEAS